MSVETLSPEQKREFARVIREHQVAFRITPTIGVVMRAMRKVGVELTLFAVSSQPLHLPVPHCPVCKEVWVRLQKLIKAVLPAEAPPRIYQFMPFMSHPTPPGAAGRKADVQALAFVYFPEQEAAGGSPLQAPLALELQALLRDLGAQDLSQDAPQS